MRGVAFDEFATADGADEFAVLGGDFAADGDDVRSALDHSSRFLLNSPVPSSSPVGGGDA
jgi:hypothetical protein